MIYYLQYSKLVAVASRACYDNSLSVTVPIFSKMDERDEERERERDNRSREALLVFAATDYQGPIKDLSSIGPGGGCRDWGCHAYPENASLALPA